MRNKLTRREFLNLLRVGCIDIFLLAAGGAVSGFLVEPAQFQVETVTLKLKRLSKIFSGIRIAQISDIHMGGWMNRGRLEQVVDLVMAQKPDLLLITGDFLIGHQFDENGNQSLKDLVDGLSPLAKSIPSFAVLGNHDYWTDAAAVRQMFSVCGITDLTNRVSTITQNGAHLHVCGVDDWWEGKPRLQFVISKMNRDGAAILLAHEPDYADRSAATGKFDLQISGHSHGGQVVIPFVGPPILPHLGRKYPIGLYTVGEMYQYTNRGVGMAGFPLRLNCPPEITIFRLESMDI